MAGPAKYLLSLEKVDPSAKVYHILYSWMSNKTANILSFSFDTPGSKVRFLFFQILNNYYIKIILNFRQKECLIRV